MASPPAALAIDSGSVLILIALAVLPLAAVLFARSGRAWGEIGGGPLAMEHDPLPPPRRDLHQLVYPGAGEVDAGQEAEKEAEIRQMVEARSYLRVRRGESPLDVEAETERQCADFIRLGE